MIERHATQGDTLPDPVPADCPALSAGGYWVAMCLTCGWEKEGRYSAGHEPEGLRLAHLQGDVHVARELLKEVDSRG
jgi:hypothetical protein